MIGEAEAYAAADSLIARSENLAVAHGLTDRDLLALAYMQGLRDGIGEHETIDPQAFAGIAA